MAIERVDAPEWPTDPFGDRRILVLIASYRDSDLPNTITSCLTQAAYPEHVRFAICHQHDEKTERLLDQWRKDPRFRLDEIHYGTSRGCCWARARTFELYDGERFMLQIDAHTRFAPRWDVRYIDMLGSIDAPKPVVTTYPPSFTEQPDGTIDFNLDVGVQRLITDKLRHDLTTRQKTEPVDQLDAPIYTGLLAAGQVFAYGTLCRDVPYDPEMYFDGEEISMAVRAFTHGYDLYCPNENLIWHRYDHGQRLHWEDHGDHNENHLAALARLETLLTDPGGSLGGHGIGSERTIADFEIATELDFSERRSDPGWRVVGDLELDTSGIELSDDHNVWVFAVFGDDDRELWRDDIFDLDVLRGRTTIVPLESPELEARPSGYIVWPAFSDGSLGERHTFELDDSLVVRPASSKVPIQPSAEADNGALTLMIERSLVEPRDDYREFVVAFIDASGGEIARRRVTIPEVLELATGDVQIHGLDPTGIHHYAVVPVRRDGNVGEIQIHRFEAP